MLGGRKSLKSSVPFSVLTLEDNIPSNFLSTLPPRGQGKKSFDRVLSSRVGTLEGIEASG